MDRIQEYALIGDGRSAALVSRRGSIDWLCWPRFDSPSIFGAILDDAAGHWRIGPAQPVREVRRRYLPGTNVLETRFFVDGGGTLVVTDLMPVAGPADQRALMLPEHEILRLVRCEQGTVDVVMELRPRPQYGAGGARACVRVRRAGKLGVRLETAAGLLSLQTDIPIETPSPSPSPSSDLDAGTVRGHARLSAGQTLEASLAFAVGWPAVIPPLGERSRAALDRSVAWWRSWIAGMRYDGPARAAVERSALALKLMIYAPSGAIIAAPTMSLPERVGGDLNWDYRFCWPRDASFTMRALLGLGFHREAGAFIDWLLHSTRLTRPRLRALYDVFGRAPARERALAHLGGHRGSRPVRAGNAASGQLQLDVYGEVVDAAAQIAGAGGVFDRETAALLRDLGRYVCRHWHEADEGIWEPRSGRAENTHSRLLCWTALDRLVDLGARGQIGVAPVALYRQHRDRIRADIEGRAWNADIGSYASRLGGAEVDASLLLLSWYGFEPASSPRVQRTYARVREDLGARGGLLYRYGGAESPGEGAFGICGFWAAELLAAGAGPIEEAERLFQQLLSYGNDVGLHGEEVDPATGEPLGNFPQAFTHVGLINAALTLAERMTAAKPARAWARALPVGTGVGAGGAVPGTLQEGGQGERG